MFHVPYTVELHLSGCWLSGPAWTFIQLAGNSTKLTCLEIAGYRIKYSTVLWILELQIRNGSKV